MNKTAIRVFVFSACTFSACTTALLGQPAYTWSATGPMLSARSGACAATLPDGRILVAGGQGIVGPLSTVELYQADGSFAPGPAMLRPRVAHTCTVLADGRVLVAGGQPGTPAIPAETFDPKTNSWVAAEFGTDRWNQTATLMPDGRVLLAGGENASGATNLLEWFDPRTNRIRSLPDTLSTARTLHAAAVLSDGSVLVAGGSNGQGLLNTAEVVQLDGTVVKTAALPDARAGHTATSLTNGCVLIAGGLGVNGNLTSASVYCAHPDRHLALQPNVIPNRNRPVSYPGSFRPAGGMAVARYLHAAVLLPNNGRVLVTGGFSDGGPTAASELFDPDTESFTDAGALTLPRLGITVAADATTGSVLAVGGFADGAPLAACGVLRGPTAAFDKTRYVDGDAVTVTGLGWTPGEKVNLALTSTTFAGALNLTGAHTIQTTASALGRIQQTVLTTAATGAGLSFSITATGSTSGLKAGSTAKQVSRTSVTLNGNPSAVLTRQHVLLQAVVQPVTSLDKLDGTVNFQTGSATLGSISSNGPVISVSSTNQLLDGTSNTLQVGESGQQSVNGFGTSFVGPDGSVRTLFTGGAFQLLVDNLPAGANTISVNAGYAPFTSLYAPNSASTTINVQKRQVSLALLTPVAGTSLKVGDAVSFLVDAIPSQIPFADVDPSGNIHVTAAPGNVLTSPLAPISNSFNSRAGFTTTLPAGVRTLSAQYDGDDVYLASGPATKSVSIAKGSPGFALIPERTNYTVGEQINLTARILHPQVIGATPTGQITRASGPTQFQGGTLGADPQNTGIIDVKLPVTGFPAPGNYFVTMTYGGDANFVSATAGAILTVAKATPVISLIPPAQITAGQEAVFLVRAAGPAGLASPPPLTGKVTLSGIANGASATLTASAGSAAGTIRQAFPTAGTFSVSVLYGGDANYQAATSAVVQVVVQ